MSGRGQCLRELFLRPAVFPGPYDEMNNAQIAAIKESRTAGGHETPY